MNDISVTGKHAVLGRLGRSTLRLSTESRLHLHPHYCIRYPPSGRANEKASRYDITIIGNSVANYSPNLLSGLTIDTIE